ncbi:cytochrome c3 family protein [Desulfobulbus oligotrophicus]|jgi:hypothetical protein|uniref:Cytochrome c3 family protein n=1 Tax=Desulfobulbus oligotrophicus TaxID=1909699 RepID=A0A7T6AQG4_9BACT|nr:cytochrome c3 family protein [Desulfobulbus oligotrophicus]MDY0389635.1 cytochrome c3 family protein [Desulfobulbus oligotrophicus]QQG65465.1 cytochrome c3 family protein [Desulfobulbus oligotrophicus]
MKTTHRTLFVAVALLLAGASPGLGQTMDEYDAPTTVTIDSLSELYEPVIFSHVRHTKLAGCKDCHHHTTGHQDMHPNCVRCHLHSPPSQTVSCKDCHTRQQFYPEQVTELSNPNIYHIDKPGLKGAYHLNCIPCHVEKNAPSHCEGCHAMTDAGKDFFYLTDKTSATTKNKDNRVR